MEASLNSNETNRIRLLSITTGRPFDELLKEYLAQKHNAPQTTKEQERERRINRHDEDNLQELCVRHFYFLYPQYNLMLNHCPCETKRDERVGAKLKRMGMRAGYPDLVLHLPRHGYGCLGLELKTPTGRQSEGQKTMQEAWERSGNMYLIIRSAQQFIDAVTWYVENKDIPLVLSEIEPPRFVKATKQRRKTKF